MATQLFGYNSIGSSSIYEYSSIPTNELGAYATTPDGRGFRYAQAGSIAMVPGYMYQSKACDAAHTYTDVSTEAIGANTIGVIMFGGTTLTKDQYAGGTISFVAGPGIGNSYKISGNQAGNGTFAYFKIFLSDSLTTATVAGTTKASLTYNPYQALTKCSLTLTGIPVGAAVAPIPAGYYGWIQTKGPSPVIVNITTNPGVVPINAGTALMTSVTGGPNAVAGAVTTLAPGGIQVGVTINQHPLNGEARGVFLTLD